MAQHDPLRVAVIGAGVVGIGAGRELLRRGFTNTTIFEKADDVGGTWHQHSYPGLACDVKAHAYTYSYAPNPDWSANFVERAEIRDYLKRCADAFGVTPKLRLNTGVVSCRYEGEGVWALTTAHGDTERFDFVINAMGNQHTPILPDVEGIDAFEGPSWHSTEWRHDVPLDGKRIVVVGSAAAAVQVVPELAKVAGELTVLQRSPNWILPRGRKPYRDVTKGLMRHLPGFVQVYRGGLEKVMNLVHSATLLGSRMQANIESTGLKHIEKQIADPELRALVTPSSRFGCKRPLVSDDFYPALQRPNVRLFPSGVERVTATGVVTSAGEAIDADVIVYCTGYRVLDYERLEVIGEEGRSLAKQLRDAPEAYKGIAVPGFPNYFLAVGPNGVLLSASYFTAMEANLACILKLLEAKEAAGVKSISVKPELHRAHNDWIASELDRFSWGHGSCDSYYRLPSGHAPFLFPGDIKLFRKHREEAGLHEYLQR